MVAVSNEYLNYPTSMFDTACIECFMSNHDCCLGEDHSRMPGRLPHFGLNKLCYDKQSIRGFGNEFSVNGCIQYGSLIQCFCMD